MVLNVVSGQLDRNLDTQDLPPDQKFLEWASVIHVLMGSPGDPYVRSCVRIPILDRV